MHGFCSQIQCDSSEFSVSNSEQINNLLKECSFGSDPSGDWLRGSCERKGVRRKASPGSAGISGCQRLMDLEFPVWLSRCVRTSREQKRESGKPAEGRDSFEGSDCDFPSSLFV